MENKSRVAAWLVAAEAPIKDSHRGAALTGHVHSQVLQNGKLFHARSGPSSCFIVDPEPLNNPPSGTLGKGQPDTGQSKCICPLLLGNGPGRCWPSHSPGKQSLPRLAAACSPSLPKYTGLSITCLLPHRTHSIIQYKRRFDCFRKDNGWKERGQGRSENKTSSCGTGEEGFVSAKTGSHLFLPSEPRGLQVGGWGWNMH